MTLDLAVKIGVKVVASGHHPVFRVICRQGCVQCFIDVVTVITSHLELLEEPITPHGKPAALIDGKWHHCPSNRQNRIHRRPPVFAREVELSFLELDIFCVYEKGRYVYAACRRCPVQGLGTCAGTQGQSSQGSFPTHITTVSLASWRSREHESLVSRVFDVPAIQI